MSTEIKRLLLNELDKKSIYLTDRDLKEISSRCKELVNERSNRLIDFEEVHCTEDEQEVNFKFTVVGTFIGDKDERVNKERVLDVWRQTDKYTAWEELANADFEIVEELQQ